MLAHGNSSQQQPAAKQIRLPSICVVSFRVTRVKWAMEGVLTALLKPHGMAAECADAWGPALVATPQQRASSQQNPASSSMPAISSSLCSSNNTERSSPQRSHQLAFVCWAQRSSAMCSACGWGPTRHVGGCNMVFNSHDSLCACTQLPHNLGKPPKPCGQQRALPITRLR
jgi:hypothetical protein